MNRLSRKPTGRRPAPAPNKGERMTEPKDLPGCIAFTLAVIASVAVTVAIVAGAVAAVVAVARYLDAPV